MALQQYLEAHDKNFTSDRRMVWTITHSPGYHTLIPDGGKTHSTRLAMDYALGLLTDGSAGRVARAREVIDAVLALQNVDPTHAHYGIWPWFAEESLEQMSPPDWNWADFIGARLAMILVEHEAKLDEGLAGRVRESLGHAAWSIFRRNVYPGYTNISIMGAGVTLSAGELLGERRLVDYGRKRLHDQLESVAVNGDFREYNSPTYTVVALEEVERILQLVKDSAAREDAEVLRRVAWRVIAEHFHPATWQWAGPHSRAYSDRLKPETRGFLAARMGNQPGAPAKTTASRMNLGDVAEEWKPVRGLPCPPDLAERFQRLPELPHQIRRVFVPHQSPRPDTIGTTWFDDAACLGSINRDTVWNQRRVLLGYWKTPEEPAVVLRLRMLKNGRDFAPACVRQTQEGPRVLSAFHFVTGAGDFHPIFGGHADNVYPGVTDLRIVYELSGVGVSGKCLEKDRFALIAGGRSAIIHAPPVRFEDREVRWKVSEIDGKATVEAVLHTGAARDLDLKTIELIAAGGLELLGLDETVSQAPVTMNLETSDYVVKWRDGMEVGAPRRAVAFAW